MAFTQQDLERQEQQLAALEDELSRLESQEMALRKEAGLPEKSEGIDLSKLTPAQRQMMEAAQEEAKRAGAARATQSQAANSSTPSFGHRPGAGRRGVVRL